MQLDIRGNTKQISRDIGITVPKIVTRSKISAMNRATKRVHTEVGREVAKVTGIKPKRLVTQTLKHYRYNKRSEQARVFYGFRKDIPLSKVVKGKTLRGAGKYSQYLKGTLKGKTLGNAFRATMPSGHQGLFVRKGSKRLPIQEVAINLQEVATPILARVGNKIGPAEFERRFYHELNRHLARSKAK